MNFKIDPAYAHTLALAKLDFVALTNSHIVDFGLDGVKDTANSLNSLKIKYGGISLLSQDDARMPVIVERDGKKLAIFSVYFEEYNLATAVDGLEMSYVTLGDVEEIQLYLQHVTLELSKIKQTQNVDFTICCIYSTICDGFVTCDPSYHYKKLAHDLVDLGIDIIYGNGSHPLLGVEVYRGKPIIYGAGDFVAPYPGVFERNDLGAIFTVNAPMKGLISHVEVLPTRIRGIQTNVLPASDPDFTIVFNTLKRMSSVHSTNILLNQSKIIIPCINKYKLIKKK